MREPMTWRTSPGQSADALRHPAIPSQIAPTSRACRFSGRFLTFAATPVLAESTPTAASPQFAVSRRRPPAACCSASPMPASGWSRSATVGISCSPTTTARPGPRPRCRPASCSPRCSSSTSARAGGRARCADPRQRRRRQHLDQAVRGPRREAPLLDIWFADEQHGLAVGAYGALLETRDGGQHWEDVSERLDNEDQFHLNAIAASRTTACWWSAKPAACSASKDWGATWENSRRPLRGLAVQRHRYRRCGRRAGLRPARPPVPLRRFRRQLEEIPLKAASGDGIRSLRRRAAGGRAYRRGRPRRRCPRKHRRRAQLQRVQPSRPAVLAGVSATGDGHLILVGQGGVHLAAANGAALEQQQ